MDGDPAAGTFFVTDEGNVHFSYRAPDGLLLLNQFEPHCSAITDNGFIPAIVMTARQNGKRYIVVPTGKNREFTDRKEMIEFSNYLGLSDSPCYAMPA